MNQRDKDRLIAILGTAMTLALLLIWIVLSEFRVNLSDIEERTWPPVDSSEIVFGGEFVKLGDLPVPVEKHDAKSLPQESAEEPAYDGTDLVDAGAKAETAPAPVASERQSPMKVEKKPEVPEKKGPTKEELAEQVGLAPAFIGHLEAPNITKALSLDALFDIAAVLEVSPYKFLVFEDD